jgi:hypothetical protein
MASNTQPIYPAKVVTNSVSFTTADTSRTAPAAAGTVYTAVTAASGGTGAIIQTLSVVAVGTTTAGVVRLFRHNGSAYFLLREFLVTAITPSTTIESWKLTTAQGADVNGRLTLNLLLQPGDSLRITTHNAEAFHASVDVGEY